jgi:hypothetical protein
MNKPEPQKKKEKKLILLLLDERMTAHWGNEI